VAQPPRDAGATRLTTTEQRPASSPVTGWRYWQLRPDGLLRSVTHRHIVWAHDEPLVARCLIGGHAAPAAGCACGIHAEPSLDVLREQGLCMAPAEPLVMGEVALWGDVVTDDHGLRAELGYPSALSLVTADADPDPVALAALNRYCPAGTATPAEALGDIAASILAFQAMSR
jgi:hypothetical protein